MTPNNLNEQLTKYLTDAHAIERQALAQMKSAPKLAGDAQIAQVFSDHLEETVEHERIVGERLEAREASPSKLKDIAGTVTGKGFGVFAASQPDTPGKLIVHAFSYEHMEEAAYALLGDVAERAGDTATVAAARRIGRQEHMMGDRLASLFDRALDASLRDLDPDDVGRQLDKYLADAHAIEGQSLSLLERAVDLAGASELADAYADHRAETEEHRRLVAERLDARGGSPSKLKDAALRLGALNWGAFFAVQPDTPAKLAAFAFAVENLEYGAYEMLRRIAERASDPDTVRVAEQILAQERAAAERIRSLFPRALEAALEEQGVGTVG
jgi:ferritin-like metal-binding protein YciE